MKGTSHTVNGSPVFIDGPDATDCEIIVNGKPWYFNYDTRFGPLWIRKDGEPRKCQNPNKQVWKAFEEWQKQWRNK
jgi:hypothetical protein